MKTSRLRTPLIPLYFAWWDAQRFFPVPNPPGAILEKLDRVNRWTAHSGTFALADGRAVPFLFWEGSTPFGTAAAGSVRVSTQRWVFAFSFSAQEAGEGFMRAIEALHGERQDAGVKLQGAYDDASRISPRACPTAISSPRGRLEGPRRSSGRG